MRRNFVLTKYYNDLTTKEFYPRGSKAEYESINMSINDLIHDNIVCFKYEYNEPDINNNKKVHVIHIIKKEGERYYEKVQEQRQHDISLSWERNYR